MPYKDREQERAYQREYARKYRPRITRQRRESRRRMLFGSPGDPPVEGQEARIAYYAERAEKGLPLFE